MCVGAQRAKGRDVSIAEVEDQDEHDENETKDEGGEGAGYSRQSALDCHYDDCRGTRRRISAEADGLHMQENTLFETNSMSIVGLLVERL